MKRKFEAQAGLSPLAAADAVWNSLSVRQQERFDAKKIMIIAQCCYCAERKPFSCLEIWQSGGDTQCRDCRAEVQGRVVQAALAFASGRVRLKKYGGNVVELDSHRQK